MKNLTKILGIIAIGVIIGFSLAGCGDNDDSSNSGGNNNGGSGTTLSGTYVLDSDYYYLTFSGNNTFTGVYDGASISGTYTVSNNTVTLTIPGYGTETMTIVNSTTLRDSDGDDWVKSGGSKPPNNGGGGNDIVIILDSNAPYGWQKTYEPASLFNGTKIVQGDKYTFTYSFKSNVAIDKLQVLFADNCQATGYTWNVISNYVVIKESIAANTVVSGTVTITATGTATDATALANRLVFQAGTGTSQQPTLTFTTLNLAKESNNGGDPNNGGGGTEIPGWVYGSNATVQSSSSIGLTWNATNGATSYKVYYNIGYDVDSSIPKTLAGTVTTGTSFTHSGLAASTYHNYWIAAVNSAGEGPISTYPNRSNVKTEWGGGSITVTGYRQYINRTIGIWVLTSNPATFEAFDAIKNSDSARVVNFVANPTNNNNYDWSGGDRAPPDGTYTIVVSTAGAYLSAADTEVYKFTNVTVTGGTATVPFNEIAGYYVGQTIGSSTRLK